MITPSHVVALINSGNKKEAASERTPHLVADFPWIFIIIFHEKNTTKIEIEFYDATEMIAPREIKGNLLIFELRLSSMLFFFYTHHGPHHIGHNPTCSVPQLSTNSHAMAFSFRLMGTFFSC